MNRPNSDVQKFKERLQKRGVKVVREIRCRRDAFTVFEVQPTNGTVKSALLRVQTSGDADLEAVEIKFASGFRQCIPSVNDPSFSSQAALQQIKFSEMRCLLDAKSISQVAQPRFTLIDSGCAAIALGNEMTSVRQFNFVGGIAATEETPFDTGVHGTGVASIVCAATNNSTYIAGIASHTNQTVKVTSCRVSDDGDTIATDDVVAAMTWCIDNQSIRGGPGVINMSLNARNPPIPSYNASPVIQAVAKSGLKFKDIFVNSAGNDGLEDPSKEKSIRRIQAVDSEDAITNFSNYGKFKGAAPGVLVAAYDKSTTSVQFATGTSFAAPIWSGAIALLMSLKPELDALKADKIVEQTGKKTDEKKIVPDLYAAVIKALKIKP